MPLLSGTVERSLPARALVVGVGSVTDQRLGDFGLPSLRCIQQYVDRLKNERTEIPLHDMLDAVAGSKTNAENGADSVRTHIRNCS